MARPDPTQFHHQHLPPHLAKIVQPFTELAGRLASTVPVNGDSDAVLEKLLEAQNFHPLRAFRHEGPNSHRPILTSEKE